MPPGQWCAVLLAAAVAGDLSAAPSTSCGRSSDAAALIGWLLDDRPKLEGLSFSDMVESATGHKVIPVDPAADRAWLSELGAAIDRTLTALNDPGHAIHSVARVNEASRFVEDRLRKELGAVRGWRSTIPPVSSGEEQRSGYPDLRLSIDGGGIVYLDPKLFSDGSETGTLRTFYYEPKTATNKIRDDARHLLVGIRHNGKAGREFRLLGWELVDASRLKVRLKAEFQASNRDIYRRENLVGSSARPLEK